jgi:hypothetical protein
MVGIKRIFGKSLLIVISSLLASSPLAKSLSNDDLITASKEKLHNINKYTTPEDLYVNMYDLEGKVVKVYFPDDNPKQISKEYFSLNGGSGTHRYLVYLPSKVGKEYFGNTRKRIPNTLYALVTVTDLVNSFGAESKGVLLIGVGSKKKTKMNGETEFSW